jgi:hypothetical protein
MFRRVASRSARRGTIRVLGKVIDPRCETHAHPIQIIAMIRDDCQL